MLMGETPCAVGEVSGGQVRKPAAPVSRPAAAAPSAGFSSGLRPLLPDILESGFSEVFWGHYDPELDVGVEGEEPRLGNRGYLRWIGKVEDQDRPSVPIPLCEIDRLGPGLFQDAFQFLADGPVPDGGVERFVRHGHVHEQTHVRTSLPDMADAFGP